MTEYINKKQFHTRYKKKPFQQKMISIMIYICVLIKNPSTF